MKQLLLGGVASLAMLLATPAEAIIITLPDNPTSATGAFNTSPGSGPFTDQVVFALTGGPQFVVIANATNVTANPGSDPIQDWVAAIWSAGADLAPGGGDDLLLFGPQLATPCPNLTNCQQVGGQGIIELPGTYFAEFQGIGSGTSGYGGNISTFAVPGPVVGAGFPGLLALAGFLGWRRLRRA